MNDFFQYGEKVVGYENRVLNEREARAGAGILFTFGLLSLTNAVMLGHDIVTKIFITFFTFDFIIRVINPNYAPSLLLGRLFVQNQTPEYVGAIQKRFAWGVGLVLALPMFYYLVINPQPTPIKVFICAVCLFLLIIESAFSICIGCKIYAWIKTTKVTDCPGGACEIKRKDKIQTFNITQKIITTLSVISIVYGLYYFTMKLENRTYFAKGVVNMLMSDEDAKALREKRYQEQVEAFENEEF